MTKSNQPGRRLHSEITSGLTDSDDDLTFDAMGSTDAKGMDHVGRHRRDDAAPTPATAIKAKTKTSMPKGQQATQRSKQGNRPDAR